MNPVSAGLFYHTSANRNMLAHFCYCALSFFGTSLDSHMHCSIAHCSIKNRPAGDTGKYDIGTGITIFLAEVVMNLGRCPLRQIRWPSPVYLNCFESSES